MMGIGGARATGGGGSDGGGEQAPAILIGVAYIQRDADTVMQRYANNSFLKNCSYKSTSGNVGQLDSGIGRITLPEGCRFFKQTFHEATTGLTGYRVLGAFKESYSGSGMGNYGQNDISGVHGVSVLDTLIDTWVEPFFFFTTGTEFVLDESHPHSKNIGMVEFYA